MLQVQNLTVRIENKVILDELNLTLEKGQIHAIMGPNGAGKSTLAKVLAGHPDYEVVSGDILLDGESILELEPSERSHLGLFMGFQYPIEIPGVTNRLFLETSLQAHQKSKGKPPLSKEVFDELLLEKAKLLGVKPEFLDRDVNGGFSGGEKKRNEILQLAMLNPKLAVLDETDSGLDIDALKAVAEGIKATFSEDRSFLLITHYQRLLDYIEPTKVHVMIDGKVVKSGGAELAKELESKGYDWLMPEAARG